MQVNCVKCESFINGWMVISFSFFQKCYMLLLHIGFLYVDHSSILYCQNNHSIEISICRKLNELLHFYFFRNAWTHMSSSRYECQSLISIVMVFSFYLIFSLFPLLQLSLATIKFVISNWIRVEGQHADLVYFVIVIESPPLLVMTY